MTESTALPYRRLLVPLDGSDLAESAIPVAQMLAAEGTAELHLVHVLEDLPDYFFKRPQHDMEWEELTSGAASEYLERLIGTRGAGGEIVANVVPGRDRVVEGLDDYCEEHGIDLVVMTTHGEGGFRRFWLGSVADQLVRRSSVPLLLLRPEDGDVVAPPGPFREVVVPLDGSSASEMAVEHAAPLAEAFGGRLVLLQVLSPGGGMRRFRTDPAAAEREGLSDDAREPTLEYLEGIAGRIRNRSKEAPASTRAVAVEREVEVDVEVVGDDRPARAILERVEAADLAVMATHGRGGFTRMMVGSVADKVLRGGTTPLLLVRSGDR